MSLSEDRSNKLRVFVSYSRDDLEFADQLVLALKVANAEPVIDRHGISGGENWQQRLGSPTLQERGVPRSRYIMVDVDSGEFVTGQSAVEAAGRFKIMHPRSSGWLQRPD